MRVLIAILYAAVCFAFVFRAIGNGSPASWIIGALWGAGSLMWLISAYLHHKTKQYQERASRFLE